MRGRESKDRTSHLERRVEWYVSTYCRWQVAWSLEPASLSERSAQVCIHVCVCVSNLSVAYWEGVAYQSKARKSLPGSR